jgi:hypothetical protein
VKSANSIEAASPMRAAADPGAPHLKIALTEKATVGARNCGVTCRCPPIFLRQTNATAAWSTDYKLLRLRLTRFTGCWTAELLILLEQSTNVSTGRVFVTIPGTWVFSAFCLGRTGADRANGLAAALHG